MARNLGKVAVDSTAFLLCDVQEAFRKVIPEFKQTILAANLLVGASEAMGIPCIATEQYPKGLGHTCAELEVQNRSNVRVFEKTSFTMATKDVLSALQGSTSAVIFGLEAHVCVQQTCLDLLEQGFDVHIVSDGCFSQRGYDRSVAFERMRSAGAHITTCESMLFMLMKDAKYEHFKIVSNMAKEYGQQTNSSRAGL